MLRASLVLVPSVLFLLSSACGGEAFTTGGEGSGGDGTGATGSGAGGSETGGNGSGGDSSGGSSGVGGSTADTSCTETIQCTLASATCCGTCATPTLSDVVPVRADEKDEYLSSLCGNDPIECPACEGPPNPNLFAECVQGECTARDLTQHEDAACTTPEDCVVIPAACCPCGAGTGNFEIVAANTSAQTFKEAQCAEASTVLCAECDWIPPDNVTATCEAGYCALSFQ